MYAAYLSCSPRTYPRTSQPLHSCTMSYIEVLGCCWLGRAWPWAERDRERKSQRVPTRSVGRQTDHPLHNKHANAVQCRSPALILLAGWADRPQSRASARGLLFGGMPAKPGAERARVAADPKGAFHATAPAAHDWRSKVGATRGPKRGESGLN
jgi:hypothetical protein